MSFATGEKKRGNPAFVKGAHPTGRSAGTPNKLSRDRLRRPGGRGEILVPTATIDQESHLALVRTACLPEGCLNRPGIAGGWLV